MLGLIKMIFDKSLLLVDAAFSYLLEKRFYVLEVFLRQKSRPFKRNCLSRPVSDTSVALFQKIYKRSVPSRSIIGYKFRKRFLVNDYTSFKVSQKIAELVKETAS